MPTSGALRSTNNRTYLPEGAQTRRNMEWDVGSCKKQNIEKTLNKRVAQNKGFSLLLYCYMKNDVIF
jgi:hypothetical protein